MFLVRISKIFDPKNINLTSNQFSTNQLTQKPKNNFLYLATAANIRVGQFLGANKPEEAINAAKVTYFLTGKIFKNLFYEN